LLSDASRNAALVGLLERRAPGARVLDIGAGTGVWSVLAARLGAVAVLAVEPTPLADLVSRLVTDNGLQDRIRVVRARVQDLPPEPMDLAFSELLNADPFYEGVVPTMRSAARWLAPSGVLSPSNLRVHVALVRASGAAREARTALAAVAALESRFGFDAACVRAWLGATGSTRGFSSSEEPASTSALVWDLALGGSGDEPQDRVVEVVALDAGPVAGAVIWFEATVDEGVTMTNPPGSDNHWGTLVCGFPVERGLRSGERVTLQVTLHGGRVEVAF
jgi:SAM-dependent methyltransferase